jgi:hypothetical protein
VAQTIAAGVIPVFVEGLKDMNNPAMRYEAAWALTNVASSEHTGVVVEAGAVPHLVRLLSAESKELCEQVRVRVCVCAYACACEVCVCVCARARAY